MPTVDDIMKEDYVYSLLMESLNSNLIEEPVSLEDVIWADSCFDKDEDSTYTNWSLVQESLLEILTSQPVGRNSTAAETQLQSVAYGEVLHSGTDIENLELSTGYDEHEDEDNEDNNIGDAESMESLSENEEGEVIYRNRKARVRRKRHVGNVFRANYTEDVLMNGENSGSGLDLSLMVNEMEPLSEDLFKVWDLEIVNEEDEFSTKLSKALSESPPVVELSVEDSTIPKDLVNVSVDDLIAGLGELSLEQVTK